MTGPGGHTALADRAARRDGSPGRERDSADDARAATARRLYHWRRARDDAFPAAAKIFGEPSWDILLDLFHHQCDGRRVAVSASCVAGARSTSTAMRHIDRLEREGLLVRRPDPSDGRRSWMHLTARGFDLMAHVLDAIRCERGADIDGSDRPLGPERTLAKNSSA